MLRKIIASFILIWCKILNYTLYELYHIRLNQIITLKENVFIFNTGCHTFARVSVFPYTNFEFRIEICIWWAIFDHAHPVSNTMHELGADRGVRNSTNLVAGAFFLRRGWDLWRDCTLDWSSVCFYERCESVIERGKQNNTQSTNQPDKKNKQKSRALQVDTCRLCWLNILDLLTITHQLLSLFSSTHIV